MRGIRTEHPLLAGRGPRREVARHVPGCDPVRAQAGQGHVGEVLADARAGAHGVGDRAGDGRRGLVVVEVAEDPLHEVGDRLAERAARRQRLCAIRDGVGRVPRAGRLERVLGRRPRPGGLGVRERARTLPRLREGGGIVGGHVDVDLARGGDGELGMRVGQVEVRRRVAEIVGVGVEIAGHGVDDDSGCLESLPRQIAGHQVELPDAVLHRLAVGVGGAVPHAVAGHARASITSTSDSSDSGTAGGPLSKCRWRTASDNRSSCSLTCAR